MQLEEPREVFVRNHDAELIKEFLLLAQRFDEVDHVIKYFLILHLRDEFNLFDSLVDVNVHD